MGINDLALVEVKFSSFSGFGFDGNSPAFTNGIENSGRRTRHEAVLFAVVWIPSVQ